MARWDSRVRVFAKLCFTLWVGYTIIAKITVPFPHVFRMVGVGIMDSDFSSLEAGAKHNWMGNSLAAAAGSAFALFIRWFPRRFFSLYRRYGPVREAAAVVAIFSTEDTAAC
jgi:hypothetical protein